MLIATPKSPIIQPIIPVITGENINKVTTIIQIFKIKLTVDCEFFVLEFVLTPFSAQFYCYLYQ